MARITDDTISWQYITGFFDGEGSVQFTKGKFFSPTLHFTNTHREVLERIRRFINTGRIESNLYRTKLRRAQRHRCYHLRVGGHERVLLLAKHLVKYAIIKRAPLEELIRKIQSKEWRAVPGYWRQHIPQARLQDLYWNHKLSIPRIAHLFRTSDRQILNLMSDYQIPRRTRSQSQSLVWARVK